MNAHHKGAAWESLFADQAIKRGLIIEKRKGTRSDLVVNGKLVQCKNIDQITGGKLLIENARPVRSNNGIRGYLRGEYDILALLHRGTVYLIPESRLVIDDARLATQIAIESFSDCIDNWQVFDANYIPPVREQQKRLFE